jgi:hypothetical protein
VKSLSLPVLLASTACAFSAAPSPKEALESQNAAVRAFSELGTKDSSLNKLFLERYSLYQRTRPEFFAADDWPYRLAAECAEELERQGQRRREQGDKLVAQIAERQRAFKDYPVPEPKTTPFDDDSESRNLYLRSFQEGYRSWLVGFTTIRCGIGKDPSREGYSAGVAAARRDHPRGIQPKSDQ